MKNKLQRFPRVTKLTALVACLVSAVSVTAMASTASPATTSGYPKIPANIIVLSAVAVPGVSLSFPTTALIWNKFVASE